MLLIKIFVPVIFFIFIDYDTSAQSAELHNTFDINVELENHQSDDNFKQTLTVNIGSMADIFSSDLTVRVYCDLLKIFESTIDESVKAFAIDTSLLQPGKNELDVTIFSSMHGEELGRTKLYVYKKSKDEIIDIEDLEDYEDNSGAVDTIQRNNRYFNFILGFLGFAGIATQLVLQYGYIVDLNTVEDDFEVPNFEVPIMALPPSIPMPEEEIILTPSITPNKPLLPHILSVVLRKWAPGATLAWAGSKALLRLIARNSKSIIAAVPPEVVEHLVKNEVVKVVISRKFIIAKLWRSIAVTALTLGLQLLGVNTKGRFFNQNAGAPEFRRIF